MWVAKYPHSWMTFENRLIRRLCSFTIKVLQISCFIKMFVTKGFTTTLDIVLCILHIYENLWRYWEIVYNFNISLFISTQCISYFMMLKCIFLIDQLEIWFHKLIMSNIWHLKWHFEISVSTKPFGIVEVFLPHTWNPHQAIMLGSVDTINDPKYHRSLKLTRIKIWKMFLWLLSSDSRTLTLTHSHSHLHT